MDKITGLRNGFTTGSCAAAAAGAAVTFLLEGEKVESFDLETPRVDIFHAVIAECVAEGEGKVRCGVLKDGGDDPDVTTGLMICATAELVDINQNRNAEKHPGLVDINQIFIDGGAGVGRVTKPGLDRSVGEAAINSVPRRMIEEEVIGVCRRNGYNGGVRILISVPGGEEIAKKTFNPRLGIVGGISILGTSGVEEPMSMKAVVDTIKAELSMHRAAGEELVAVSPGSYAGEVLLRTYGFDIERSVKCSNFIGDTLELVSELGFKGLLIFGHIGKLVKLSGGITNTHSMYADCRMELIAAASLKAGAEAEIARNILDCIASKEALRILDEAGLRERTMDELMKRIMSTLEHLTKERFNIECMLLSNEYGVLSKSSGAERMLERIREGT